MDEEHVEDLTGLEPETDGVDEAADGPPGTVGSSGSRWSGRRPLLLVVAALVAALVVGGAVWWLRHDTGPGEGVALQVSGTTFTADDVDDRVQALVALYGVEVPTDEKGLDTFRRDAAKSMAVQVMLEDEAAERSIVVADKEVTDTLDTIVEERYAEGGRPAFIAALGEMGATEEQVLDEIRNQLMVARVFDDVVRDVDVTDDDLRRAFGERREQLGTPARRVLRNAVVADRPSAVRIVLAFRAGKAFSSLARRASLDEATREDGGYLGAVAATDLEPAYAEKAFAAEVGDTFGPVRTQYGWNVGFVQAAVPAEPATYATIRGALRETVLAEESLTVWRSWLGDVIADHDVDYADDYLPADPDAVPDVDQVAPTTGETGR
ncbi:MAG: hypothetical protein JWN84_3530 [Nocardioides sp.]|nr:hypothetical protein [Nocardioides sp.]